mgnify:CR=1 FL=1
MYPSPHPLRPLLGRSLALVWCTNLRTAGRILACQQFSCACLHAARLGQGLNAYSGDELVYSSTLGDWRTHNGVDYACAQDAQVCAPAAGKVTAVDTDSRWGSVVCIEDSAGHLWRVCGTADPTVQTGDEVSVGQILGRAGSIPNECARRRISIWKYCRVSSTLTRQAAELMQFAVSPAYFSVKYSKQQKSERPFWSFRFFIL